MSLAFPVKATSMIKGDDKMKDLKEIASDAPTYESVGNTGDNITSNLLTVRIRRFANTAPLKITGVEPNSNVGEFEKNLSRKMAWSDRTTRLSVDGRLLDRNEKMGDLMARLGDSAVLDTIPDHSVGAQNHIIPPRIPSSFFPIIATRQSQTDFTRLLVDLMDLTAKKEYGKKFSVHVNSTLQADLLYPQILIEVSGRFYPLQMIMAGYPNYIKGMFLESIPPCPIHGRKNPHIFIGGEICWDNEKTWNPKMPLYEEYILFLIKTLNNPKEHYTCQI